MQIIKIYFYHQYYTFITMSVGNDTYGIIGNPFYGWRARGCAKSGFGSQHKDRLPRFGPQGCVKPYNPALVDIFSVLELSN